MWPYIFYSFLINGTEISNDWRHDNKVFHGITKTIIKILLERFHLLILALPGSSIGRRECKEGAGEMEVFKNARCVAPWMKYYSRTVCCRVTMLSCPGPPASEAISLVQLCVSATWRKFIAPDSWPPLPPEGSSNVKNVGEVNLSVACGLHVQSEGWRRRPCQGRQ